MAIVQISRIQHRRGLKESLPQLAAGEIGFAVDTQELFIGNGTTAEGAPEVGNTKIITEDDKGAICLCQKTHYIWQIIQIFSLYLD